MILQLVWQFFAIIQVKIIIEVTNAFEQNEFQSVQFYDVLNHVLRFMLAEEKSL